MKMRWEYSEEELQRSRASITTHKKQPQMHALCYLHDTCVNAIRDNKPLVYNGLPCVAVMYRMDWRGNHDPKGNHYELHLVVTE